MSISLDHLNWYRIRADLKANHTLNTLAYSVLEAITKEIKSNIGYEGDIIYHITKRSFRYRLRADDIFTVEIILPRATYEDSQIWADAIDIYFQDSWNSRNVSLINLEEPELRNYEVLRQEKEEQLRDRDEICLDFLTPTPIKIKHPKKRAHIEERDFIGLFTSAINKLFGVKHSVSLDDDTLRILVYWNYEEYRVNSFSQRSSSRLINGCMGKVYIKGALEKVIPLLLICEEIHAGSSLTYGRGYYVILSDSYTSFINTKTFQDSLQFYIEKNRNKIDNSSIEEVTSELYNAIVNATYEPQPPEAFVPDGSQLLAEKFHWKDMVVQSLLYKILKNPIDNMLPLTVFSYRPHISADDIKSKVDELLNSGYTHVALIQLERLYKEIDHDYLLKALSELIPKADHFIVKIIEKIIKTGYWFNGAYHHPTKGLPVGSPLSAMLTNVYLLEADKALNTDSTVALRHADTYLLMSQSEEKLSESLTKAEKILRQIGFKVDKKAVKLGKSIDIKFAGVSIHREKKIENLRKPLYIVNPDMYLSLQSDTVKISSSDKTIENIPISRISEVIITADTTVSTPMLRKLLKNQIPIVISSNFKSSVAIVRIDNKTHYDDLINHYLKYKSLSEDEILMYAKEIARLKLKSYEIFFSSMRHLFLDQQKNKLSYYRQKICEANSIDIVRGYEAIASRENYLTLNSLIKDSRFHIKKRKRREPDLINSLLNLCSHITFNRIRTISMSLSLNPYLGFLHSSDNNYESLCADIQELLRARMEHFIITLINRRIIKVQDFTQRGNSYVLTSAGVQKFIKHLEEYFNRTYNSEQETINDFIYRQLKTIKRWVKEEEQLSFEIPW